MTEREYHTLADAFFARLEDRLSELDEVDFELGAGGVLQIEFADASCIVVNRQAVAQEIWVAAKSGGFHFRHVDGKWRDIRGGEELFAALSRLASEQAGTRIDLGD